MKSTIRSIAVLTALLLSTPVFAGKVDEVKNAVKEKCKIDLPAAQILESVIKAYDCNDGVDVKLEGCTIKCLKGNAGNVVGGK